MNIFEKPQFEKNPNAKRRKERAEREGKISISDWKGTLHVHSKKDITNPKLPEEIAETREGSNCAEVPLEILVKYHSEKMKNEIIAITEHLRDADPQGALKGIKEWFVQMYSHNEKWMDENFLGIKKNNELSDGQKEEIEKLAEEKAEEVALYGNERLEKILKDIDATQNKFPIKILKGVEANLMPDGTFGDGSEMINESKFELVNCSIHPKTDEDGFKNIIADPEKYTDLTVKGIQNPKTNIICHIGYDCGKELVENLGWEKIAGEAVKNNVAIEINLKDLLDFIEKKMLNYEEKPKANNYAKEFEKKLPELIPIISSSNIREKLKSYFEKGLKIAINTDEHKSKFIKTDITKENTRAEFKKRDIRYWKCLKMVEKYFNVLFAELNIKKENIINTYSADKLEKFIKKDNVNSHQTML